MKKIISLFGIALMALVSFTITSCGSDDDDPTPVPTPTPTTITYIAPLTEAYCDLSTVRAYMAKNLKEFKEDNEISKDGSRDVYTFRNNLETSYYSYTFKNGKLVGSDVHYNYMTEKLFTSLKDQVSTKYGVKEWKEQPSSAGVNWWSTDMPGDISKGISIGKSANYGGYMYVSFSFIENF